MAKSNNNVSQEIVVWCGNDYFGMSQNPRIINIVQETIYNFGIGSGGSRDIASANIIHVHLEELIADWYSKETALIFSKGFSIE